MLSALRKRVLIVTFLSGRADRTSTHMYGSPVFRQARWGVRNAATSSATGCPTTPSAAEGPGAGAANAEPERGSQSSGGSAVRACVSRRRSCRRCRSCSVLLGRQDADGI